MSPRLKLFMPLLVFAVLAAIFLTLEKRMVDGSYSPSELPSALIGKPLPEFRLPRLRAVSAAGEPVAELTREDLTGEAALLNVWATWCVACRAEHPYLNALAARGVAIYGINYKDERKAALEWLQRLGDPYRLSVFDAEGRLGLDLGVYGAPETFIIDSTGIVRYRHVGVMSERVWRERIDPLGLWPAGTGE